MREIMRAVVIAILVFMMALDLKEIVTNLANSSEAVRPVVEWMYSGNGKAPSSHRSRNSYDDYESSASDEENLDSASSSLHISGFSSDDQQLRSDKSKDNGNNNPMFDPALDAVRKKLQAVGYTTATGEEAIKSKALEFSEEEKQQILSLKTHLTNVMQSHCLPKLVCELHASISERGSLSEAERGLLSLIRETSLGTMGEVVSRYHFAAHMGQLLSGVEGNGCYNLYPNCPLSGNKVLSMVKKVRVR